MEFSQVPEIPLLSPARPAVLAFDASLSLPMAVSPAQASPVRSCGVHTAPLLCRGDAEYRLSPRSLTVVASQTTGILKVPDQGPYFPHLPGIKGSSACLVSCRQPPHGLPFPGA